MITLHQLKKGARTQKKSKIKSPALKGCPQRRGFVTYVGVMKPKKPNSAQRKIAKVRLNKGREITVYIPGRGHNLQKHADVLVRGGRVPDLPGVRYHLFRQKLDFDDPESFDRKARRSKFGKKREIKKDN